MVIGIVFYRTLIIGTIFVGFGTWKLSDGAEVFDCTKYSEDVPLLWPAEHAEWCCVNKRIGCSSPLIGSFAENKASSTSTSEGKKYIAEVLATAVNSAAISKKSGGDKYNCYEETLDPVSHWPWEKRDWCCQHRSSHCADILGMGASAAVEHNCDVQGPSSQTAWAPDKLVWCCEHRGVACDNLPDTDATLASSLKQQAARYDCTVPESVLGPRGTAERSFFDSWPAEKRRWCCEHEDEGCGAAMSSTQSSQREYQCLSFGGLLMALDDDVRRWCCKHKSQGCARGPRAVGNEKPTVDWKKLFAKIPTSDGHSKITPERPEIPGREPDLLRVHKLEMVAVLAVFTPLVVGAVLVIGASRRLRGTKSSGSETVPHLNQLGSSRVACRGFSPFSDAESE